MKKISLMVILLVLLSSMAYGANVQMSWSASPEIDVANYEIYFGNASGAYSAPIIVAGRTTTRHTFVVPDPVTGGNMHFALAAVDTSGNRSALSTEAVCFIPDMTAPAAPQNILLLVRIGD